MTGMRLNTGKAPMHLLPWDALIELANHYGYGAKKYAARNWEKGLKWNEGCAASLERHLAKWAMGEDFDEEGQRHDIAILWNAIALVAFRIRGVGEDDRPKVKAPVVEPPRPSVAEEFGIAGPFYVGTLVAPYDPMTPSATEPYQFQSAVLIQSDSQQPE